MRSAALPVRLSAAVARPTTINPIVLPLSSTRAFSSTPAPNAKYGFIGLGNMGFPMAKNLASKLESSDKLLVYDRNKDSSSKFLKEAGNAGQIQIAHNAREVAEQSEAIITALPESSHVHHVFHSILHPKLPPISSDDPNITERLFIDCSTINPTASREIANAVHSTAQGRFVDAPMSGGVIGARKGNLTFMLGALSKHGGLIKFRIRPLLEKMGGKVLHLGGQGAGLAAKLANNYLLAVSNVATAEAMSLGQRWGLDASQLAELINGSSGQCWSSTANNPVPGVSEGAPANNDYDGGFSVELMKKDLGLALEEAKRVAAKADLGEKSMKTYETVAAVEPGKDFSIVYKWMNEEQHSRSPA